MPTAPEPPGAIHSGPASPVWPAILYPRTLGSLLSALVGWLVVVPFALVATVTNGLGIAVAILFVYAVTIAVVWLVALFPLYSLVPRRSILWFWPVCTFCGFAAGTLIAFASVARGLAPDSVPSFFRVLLLSSALGGIMGAATCLFGSLTAPYFLGKVPPGSPPPAFVGSSTSYLSSQWLPRRHHVRFPKLRRAASSLRRKFEQIAGQ